MCDLPDEFRAEVEQGYLEGTKPATIVRYLQQEHGIVDATPGKVGNHMRTTGTGSSPASRLPQEVACQPA